MGLQSFIKFLLPKEDKFYELLEQQGQLSHEVAQALATFSDPSKSNQEISTTVQEIEHRGDDLEKQLEEALAKTFVTPIDREDIHKLSTELDDIVDFCNQAARASVLFAVERPTPAMTQLANILVGCTAHISSAMSALRNKNFNQFYVVKGAVKELEKEADTIYRHEVSSLFVSEASAKSLMAQKEVLDKLENAIDRCEDITAYLVNLAVKHA